MIKFVCPGGHQLTAPENLAGKPGRCPKCNAPFVVPAADSAAAGGSTPTLAEGSHASRSAVTPAMGSGKGQAGAGELFIFLCPNGHKLNGPPTLKGKPGQCPHCGARFIIPTDDDIPPDDFELEGLGEGADFAEEPAERPSAVDRPPSGASGLGYIVARLWEQRTEQTELEIFLAEGEIIAPDFYSETLSTSDYGVFAVEEGDGSLAITVIPWAAVRRVGMRRVTELPPGLFTHD
jgi:hypothetical protein